MKLILCFLAFLLLGRAAYADVRGINVELHRTASGKTTVDIFSSLPQEDRKNATLEEAAAVLRTARHIKDGVFVVIHSADVISTDDLGVLFKAMAAGDVGLQYIQMGVCPTGMDLWKSH